MAESCTPVPTGGYTGDFVDSLPESLSCPVCLLAFRDPHILSCCGAKYCEVCINRVKADNKPCPLCNQPFQTMLDKSFQRKVLGLRTHCSRRKNGCDWEGELRHLDYHERGDCMWALVECRYSCGELVPRRQLVEHERDLCPQRPVDVKLESFMKKMEAQLTIERNRHEQEMAAIREEFAKALQEERESRRKEIESKEKSHTAEMEELKEYVARKQELIRKSHADEMTIMREEFKREMEEKEEIMKKMLAEQEKKDEYAIKMKEMEESLVRVRKMEEVIPQLKDTLTRSCPVPSVEFTMNEYKKHKRDDDYWYSSPFYSGSGGYKLCISIVANGRGVGTSSCVSVFVFLMRGEYDDWLAWPFRGDITIQLVNHKSDHGRYERSLNFVDVAAAAPSQVFARVISGERTEHGWGIYRFISHTELESTTTQRQFLKNDSIKFRVTNIVVHSV